MLQQFTWQQFLVAAMVFSLIWYLGLLLIFYRQQLLRLLEGDKVESDQKLPHRWDENVEALEEERLDDGLLGKPKLPEGMASVPMNAFGFVPSVPQREQQLGLVPDLLQELKEVFVVIAGEDGTKRDFFNLMEMVREKFPKIASNPNIPQINQYIIDHAPFHLSAEELENIWD